MNGLEAEFGASVTFVRLNANQPENETYQRALGLRGHPTVALLTRDGEVSERFIGEQSAESLRDALRLIRATPAGDADPRSFSLSSCAQAAGDCIDRQQKLRHDRLLVYVGAIAPPFQQVDLLLMQNP